MSQIQKTTLKRYNGTDWDPIHMAGSGDIVQIGSEFKVMGKDIGAFKNGDTIKSTDDITSVIKRMLQTRIAATYTAPKINFTGSQGAGNYEVGTNMNCTLTATFTQNDAGALTSIKINQDGSEIATGTTSPLTHTWTETLGDGSVTFQGVANYGDGAIKKDNLGDSSPTGAITAGSKSATLTYTGIRKAFYGADSTTGNAITTSSGIRALTATAGEVKKGSKFTISVPKGAKKCTIAFKATIGELAAVTYRESGNANITAQFTKSSVDVEGANGYTAVPYNVYTVAWAQPAAGSMTFDVVI